MCTATVLLAILSNVLLGFGGNVGLPFGYYGKLNLVTEMLGDIPGVSVEDVGLHEDATLEDFWITIAVDGVPEELEFLNANVRTVEDLSVEFAHLRDTRR